MFIELQLLRGLGVVELLFTSDGAVYMNTTLQRHPNNEVLLTINFMNENKAFDILHQAQVSLRWWSE